MVIRYLTQNPLVFGRNVVILSVVYCLMWVSCRKSLTKKSCDKMTNNGVARCLAFYVLLKYIKTT